MSTLSSVSHRTHLLCWLGPAIDLCLALQERLSAEAAARDSVIAELNRRAAQQAATSALAQQHAINWLQATVDTEDAEYVKRHMDIIQNLLSSASLLPVTDAKAALHPSSSPRATAVGAITTADVTLAAAQAAAVEHVQMLAKDADTHAPVAAALTSAATAQAAAAVVKAAVTEASAAEATASSAAAVAALQAAAADRTAPAAVVAQAVGEAARALAAAKAKATATAEAALQAAVAQEQQRVVKKANQQLFAPLTHGLGGLVDYTSDEDSHTSRARTDSQSKPDAGRGHAEVSSAEWRALAAQQDQPSRSHSTQPASLLPMYNMDQSSSHQQASSGQLEELQADATGASPRAGHLEHRAGLIGAGLPCSRLSGQQLGEVLDSMRELSSVHMNLSLLHHTGVLAFVDCLQTSLVRHNMLATTTCHQSVLCQSWQCFSSCAWLLG